MTLDLQTVCVIRPAYLQVAFLMLAASIVASALSIAVAIVRRFRRQTASRRPLRMFHLALLLVCVAYGAVVAIEWIGGQRALREYELSTRKAAPAVRSAMGRETRAATSFGAVGAVLATLSAIAWRRVPPLEM